MTVPAFLLILASVFLHVTWNMLSKKSNPSMAFYMIMGFVATLMWLPVFCFCKIPFFQMPGKFFIFLLLSIFGEIIYMLGLARSYKSADISYVYPVVRALPVLIIAAVTIIFGLGKTPSLAALGGMVIITAGCLLMPLKNFRDFALSRYFNKTIFFILLAASGTTFYTLFDSSAIKIVREMRGQLDIVDTLSYLFLMEAGLFIGECIFVMCNKQERSVLKELLKAPLSPVIAGLSGSAAYALILFAFAFVTNVSFVQAFRQMSLPLGFFAGVIILHEKASRPKLLGLILIVTGLVLIALLQ